MVEDANDDNRFVYEIILRDIQAPVRQIAYNAGQDGAVVAGKLLEGNDVERGYDAQIGEYTNLIEAGIVDPTKVVRTALQDAASVAGLMITTEAMIAERPEPKEASAGAPDKIGRASC